MYIVNIFSGYQVGDLRVKFEYAGISGKTQLGPRAQVIQVLPFYCKICLRILSVFKRIYILLLYGSFFIVCIEMPCFNAYSC